MFERQSSNHIFSKRVAKDFDSTTSKSSASVYVSLMRSIRTDDLYSTQITSQLLSVFGIIHALHYGGSSAIARHMD